MQKIDIKNCYLYIKLEGFQRNNEKKVRRLFHIDVLSLTVGNRLNPQVSRTTYIESAAW